MSMATYVLVHGAWGGAHVWRKVRPLLRTAGHDVFTSSLTGIGERSHLSTPQVNLSMHIEDIVNVLHYEDLSDIVLVGFSHGGMVVTGVVDRMGERVAHLVYLDAFLPSDGDSAFGMIGSGMEQQNEGDWLVPSPARQYDDPAEQAWAETRRVGHPRGCFTEPVHLSKPLEQWPFSRTYIKATGEPRPSGPPHPFWRAADSTRNNPAWRYREIETTHMVPHNKPEELIELLLEVIR